MRGFKKFLACTLSALMILSAFPMTALADEVKHDASGEYNGLVWQYTASTDTLYINTNEPMQINGVDDPSTSAKETSVIPTYYLDGEQNPVLWKDDFRNLVIGNNITCLNKIMLGYDNVVGYFIYPELESVTFEENSKLEVIKSNQFYKSAITEFEIPSSVTRIDTYAFGRANLAYINVPETVEEINSRAFEACKALTAVDYNASYVPTAAFNGCSALTTVTFGNATDTIMKNAFYNCLALTSIDCNNVQYIEKSAFEKSGVNNLALQGVQEIGERAFHGCRIDTITYNSAKNIPENGGKYKSLKIGKYAFEDGEINTLTLPSDIEVYIGDYAFYNAGINNIVYDETGNLGVVEIGQYAFAKNDFVNFSMPFNKTGYFGWGKFIFADCKNMLTADISNLPTLNQIPDGIFANCDKLQEVTLQPYCKIIEEDAFSGCTSLTTINNSSTIYEVEKGAFENCKSLTHFDSQELRRVGYRAFACSGLTSITLSDTSPHYNSNKPPVLGEAAFSNCTSLTSAVLQSDLEDISPKAFYMCVNFKNITIPDSVKTIGAKAFAKTSVTRITIPQTVTTISDSILNIEDGENNENLIVSGYTGSEAHRYAKRNDIAFNSLGVVDGYVEEGSGNGGSTQTPTPTPTPDDEYQANKLFGTWSNGTWKLTFTNSNSGGYYRLFISGDGEMDNNIAIDNNGRQTTFAELSTEYDIQYICINEGVKSIPDNFMYIGEEYRNENLHDVALPRYSLEAIGDNAFKNCLGLKNIAPSAYQSFIRAYHFSYIPSSVKYVGSYAFANCEWLTDYFVFPENTLEIEEGTFLNCKSILQVYTSGNLKKIGKKAFTGCEQMNIIAMPTALEDVYYDAENPADNALGFDEDGNRLSVYLRPDVAPDGAGVEYCQKAGLPYNVSIYCAAKDSGVITLKSVIKSFCLYWYYIESTNTVYIERGNSDNSGNNKYDRIAPVTAAAPSVKQNGDTVYYLFEKGLYSGNFNVSGNQTPINKGDYKVKNLVVGEGVVAIDCPEIFSYFDPEYIELPSTLTSLKFAPFKGCERLKSVAFPDSITSITSDDFSGCASLEAINLGSGITRIPDKAFENCSKLKAIAMPSAQTIGTRAFYNCVSLQQINLPDSVRTIGAKAFYNCASAQSLKIGENVTSIGNDAFDNLVCCDEIKLGSFINNCDAFNNIGSSTTGVDLVIGNSVNAVNFDAFKKSRIVNLSIGSGVQSISGTQYLPYVKNITLSDSNNSFYLYNNGLYTNNNVLTYIPALTENASIKAGTTAIADYAAYGINADSINIPQGVTAIGAYAFANAKRLKHMDIAKGTTTIGEGAFEGCSALRVFYAPNTLTNIGASAFKDCVKLASVVLLNKTKNIGAEAFMGCSSLICVVFNEALENMGDRAFADCVNLEEVYIWYDTELGNGVFDNDDKLVVHTMVGSDAYRYAREFGVRYLAYTDEDLFYDVCGEKFDIYAGYLGYCTDGHGETEYLTVYAADCEHDGYVIGVCEFCSEIVEEIHTDAYGHNYKLKTQIAATATTRGVKVYSCINCGEEYSVYTEPTDEDFLIETHKVTAQLGFAADKSATKTVAPVKNVDVVLGNQVIATSDSEGKVEFELETGSYELELRYAYGLSRTIYVVIDDMDITYEEPIAIIGCDFNRDGIIDNGDLELFQIVISAKKDDPSYLDFVDINGDGYINAVDRLYLKSCKGATQTNVDYPEVIICK